MRFEPRSAFKLARSIGVDRASHLPSSVAFLFGAGPSVERLQAAAARAERDRVCPLVALTAHGGVSETLAYKRLSEHLGGCRFEAGWPQLATPVRPCRIGRDGVARLSDGRLLVAPTGPMLSSLLRAWDRGTLDTSRLVVTTPAHLAAIVRLRAANTIAYVASDRLPDADPSLSARTASGRRPVALGALALLLTAATPLVDWTAGLTLLALLFLAGLVLRLLVCAEGSLGDTEAAVTITDADAPNYTVLVPLHDEADMVPDLVAALDMLDYPRTKLEILVLLEEGDRTTRGAFAGMALPPTFRVIVVPDGFPRTKPRALNAGLALARGTLLTVYDAEDRPEPDQLRKAAGRFATAPASVGCLQARLAITTNARCLLGCLFAIEYRSLFDVFNVGVSRLGLPMALGGTSNHVRVATLETIGGWDAWNVTEDADLGLRLARFGYATETLASTTFEGAPRRMAQWMPQRRRWTKGWMQTAIVLVRDWPSVTRDLGIAKACVVALLLFNLVAGPLLAPIFSVYVCYDLIVRGLPNPVGVLEVSASTIFWAVLALGIVAPHWIAWLGLKRARSSCPWMALPFVLPYQFLVSAAAWLGLYDLFRTPFHWHKTMHEPEDPAQLRPGRAAVPGRRRSGSVPTSPGCPGTIARSFAGRSRRSQPAPSRAPA